MTRTSMRDVSEKTGLSVATVWRAINGGHVKPETKERVLTAIRELGYHPPTKKLVGLILPDSSNPFFAQLIFAFEREFTKNGFHVLPSSSEGRADREVALIEQMLGLEVSGIILVSVGDNPGTLLKLVSDPEVPVVVFDRQVGAANVDVVTVDSRKGTQTAIDHLVALGHRRIAYIKGPDNTQTGRDRYSAFCDSLAFHRIELPDDHLFPGRFDLESGRRAAASILGRQRGVWPSAIMAGNDLMAIGAATTLHANGVRVPQGISIVGFDDIEMAGWIHPPLTTIQQPITRLVREAVRLLAERVEERGRQRKRRAQPRSVVIEPRLIVRGSTGPASNLVADRQVPLAPEEAARE